MNQMSAVQVAPSSECSQSRGRYCVVCRGNPVLCDPYHERLELKFHERRYTSTLYLTLPYLKSEIGVKKLILRLCRTGHF